MKKLALICSVLILSACTRTVILHPSFPSAPPALQNPCPQLDVLKKDNPQLSDLLTTVTGNYVKYHDCATKVDAWNDWYNSQKQIFQNATK